MEGMWDGRLQQHGNFFDAYLTKFQTANDERHRNTQIEWAMQMKAWAEERGVPVDAASVPVVRALEAQVQKLGAKLKEMGSITIELRKSEERGRAEAIKWKRTADEANARANHMKRENERLRARL